MNITDPSSLAASSSEITVKFKKPYTYKYPKINPKINSQKTPSQDKAAVITNGKYFDFIWIGINKNWEFESGSLLQLINVSNIIICHTPAIR